MGNFNSDLKAEEELGKYLDKYFYTRYKQLKNVVRINDGNEQYSGIDVKARLKEENIFIDEKGYLSINMVGSTFALELSYLKEKKRKNGWLFDKSKITTHYLFCWNKRNDNIKHQDVKEKDFHYIIAMLVDREKLLRYLQDTYQINKITAASKVEEILENDKSGSLDTLNEETKSKYFFSTHLSEEPINIVMNKKELESICESYFLVKRTELKAL
ncbi:hypothetical protein [Psychrobacillus sp. BL-248-WT-3]|uniref:hypothetical protein n=1 Tax=Psychrobacillus sp. BL-248-WT-3 TaxID=2725306 RepID=UPI00146A61F7|nr:hypothetical protein [Psychrobacillus sp. BL-248-WT-3]NME06229.1 hypothetical protein [Psychrobacillus sp. BL-248-WT-3]